MSEINKYASQTYYRIDNIADTSVPYLLNSCGEIYIKKHFETRMSRGRRDYYLMYIISGSMDARVGDASFILERGNVLCISPNTPYFYARRENSEEHVRYRFLHFTGSRAGETLSSLSLPLNTPVEVEVKEEVVGLWDELFRVFRGQAGRIDALSEIMLTYILMKVGQSAEAGRAIEKKLDQSIKYIHTHLSENLSVETLANMEFLSTSRYREVFRSATGHSPVEYITLLRIRQACELLAENGATIEDTAAAVGYSDRLYFQRVFKKHMGITPGKYVKKLKNRSK